RFCRNSITACCGIATSRGQGLGKLVRGVRVVGTGLGTLSTSSDSGVEIVDVWGERNAAACNWTPARENQGACRPDHPDTSWIRMPRSSGVPALEPHPALG